MISIGSAGNSTTACLQEIINRGYKVSTESSDDRSFYYAKKDGYAFSASNGMELLGLVVIGEQYGDNWREVLGGKDTWENIEYLDVDKEVELEKASERLGKYLRASFNNIQAIGIRDNNETAYDANPEGFASKITEPSLVVYTTTNPTAEQKAFVAFDGFKVEWKKSGSFRIGQ